MPHSFTDLFSKMYYGNSIGTWLLSLSLLLASILLSKLIYRLIQFFGQKITSRTKSNLDDAIFDSIEEPVGLLIGFFGASYAISLLHLPEAIQTTVANGFYFTYVFCIAWTLNRAVSSLFQEVIVPFVDKTENQMDDQLLPIVRRGVSFIIWTMAFIIGVNNAGYDVGAVLAGLGIGGLAFALAAQDTVQNLFGGLTIFIDQPFKINDRVKVEGFDGTIIEIGTRSTRLKTLEGRVVTLPNSKFTDQAVENVSSEESRKIKLDIGLTYDMSAHQIEQALQLLKDIAAQQSGVLNHCIVAFDGFGDFSLNIYLIYYIEKSSTIPEVKTELNLKVLKEFSKAGLEMAFPSQTLYHTNADTSQNTYGKTAS